MIFHLWLVLLIPIRYISLIYSIRMVRAILLVLLSALFLQAAAQTVEVTGVPPVINGQISQTLKVPFRLKNTSDKSQLAVIRLSDSDFRATQKGYFCIDGDCLDAGIDEITRRLEPGASLSGISFVLESGLVAGQNNLAFDVYLRGISGSKQEFQVLVNVEEKGSKTVVYQSALITIHDVYPNPVSALAFMDYDLYRENISAKIVLHNILGVPVGEQELPHSESRAKISTEELPPGIYFYTVYLDNEGILTKKLVVRR